METTNDILQLLGSIIETEVCRKQLANSSWISLLVGLLHYGSSSMQDKAMGIIFELLPLCSPHSLTLDIPILSEKSEPESNTETPSEDKGNSISLVLYFIRVIGLSHLQSNMNISAEEAAQVKPANLNYLATFYTLLVRNLLSVPAWHDVIIKSLEESLGAQSSVSQWSKNFLELRSRSIAAIGVLGGGVGFDQLEKVFSGKQMQSLSIMKKNVTFNISSVPSSLVDAVMAQFKELVAQASTQNKENASLNYSDILHPLHSHRLALSSRFSGWQCDGQTCPGGCRGGGGGSGPRYRCVEGCDFDLCRECMISGVQVKAREVRLPNGVRIPFNSSVDDMKLEIQKMESIEWIEDLSIVAEGSWKEVESQEGCCIGNASGVLWAVMSNQQARDVAFTTLVNRLYTITSMSNLLHHRPLAKYLMGVGEDAVLSLLMKMECSEVESGVTLADCEYATQLITSEWHSRCAKEVEVETMPEEVIEKKSPSSLFHSKPTSKFRLKAPSITLPLTRCLRQSLEVISIAHSKIKPITDNFLSELLNFLLNGILCCVWKKVDGSCDLTFEMCSEAIAEFFVSRGQHEVLSIIMEAIAVRRLQGWEEENAWGEATESLKGFMEGQALVRGVGQVDSLVPSAIICCIEVITVDMFEFLVDSANDDPGILDDGTFLDPSVMCDVLEDQEGRVILDLLKEMERSRSSSSFGDEDEGGSPFSFGSAPAAPALASDSSYITPEKSSPSEPKKEEAGKGSPEAVELSELGFPLTWCEEALRVNNGNVEMSLNWILSQGQHLSEAKSSTPQSDEVKPETVSVEADTKELVSTTAESGASEVEDKLNGDINQSELPPPLPPLVEDKSCYSSILGGVNDRLWDVPPSEGTHTALKISFRARTEEDIGVRLVLEDQSKIEVILACPISCIRRGGSTVASVSKAVCDPTRYVKYEVLVAGKSICVSVLDPIKAEPYLVHELASEILVNQVGFGGSGRVFFKEIGMVRCEALVPFTLPSRQTSTDETDIEVTAYDTEDYLDGLFNKPKFQCLEGKISQDRGRRRGGFGFGLGGSLFGSKGSSSVWHPASSASEFATQCSSMSEAALFDKLDKLVGQMEVLHAHEILTQIIAFGGDNIMSMLSDKAGIEALECFLVVAAAKRTPCLEEALVSSIINAEALWLKLISSAKAHISNASADSFQHENWDNLISMREVTSKNVPSIPYVSWLTELVLGVSNHELDLALFRAWLPGLKTVNVFLKKRACSCLALLLDRAYKSRQDMSLFKKLLPLKTLAYMLEARITIEQEGLPGSSGYLKALLELRSVAHVAFECQDIDLEMPPTCLHFHGNTGIRLNRSDGTKCPWTFEFWLIPQGLSTGHRLAVSDNCSCIPQK